MDEGDFLGLAVVFIIDYTKYLTSGYAKNMAALNLVLAFINLSLILAGGIVLGVINGIALKKILQ